jgi:antitoxin component of MazEF toxin-antitoxin module
MKSLLVIHTAVEVSLANEIVLYTPTRSQLKKLLKLTSKRTRNNEIQFGINKCTNLVV